MAAYRQAMVKRYALRLDPEGWTVVDRTSDRAVVIAGRKQQGLEFDDAENCAERLNGDGRHGLPPPRNPVSVRRT